MWVPMVPQPMKPICITASRRTLVAAIAHHHARVAQRSCPAAWRLSWRSTRGARLGQGSAKVHVCDMGAKALAALKNSDPKIHQSIADVADRGQVERLFKQAVKAGCSFHSAGARPIWG